jgi:hypothetical protein
VSANNSHEAKQLYDYVIQTSNRFLHNCKHFSIEVLQAENPTYAEVAAIMKQVAKIIEALADDLDPLLGCKAHEYCELMTGMGVAIATGERITLHKLVAELERRSGL